MKQEVKNSDNKMLTISIEEFDTLNGNHRFSKEYQRQKRKMWKEYRKRVYGSRRNYAKTAVAASLLIVTIPVAVNAANDSDFFNRIWGNAGKKNIEAHDEVIYHDIYGEEEGGSFTYTHPKREYIDITHDKAEELIGENISKKRMEEQLGDTKLTILSAVSDGQSAVVEFTLERKGGVNALEYSQETNEDKGAAFTDDATFYFCFTDYDGCIYVDLDRSTDEKLYCYDYMTYSPFSTNTSPKELQLELTRYPCTLKELEGKDGYKYQKDVKTKTISFPLKKQVDTTDFVNTDGGIVTVSPLSINIDMATGLGLSLKEYYPDLDQLDPEEEPYDASKDSGSIYYIAITDTKGETYIVEDRETENHTCDVPIDNTTYACGDEYSHLICTFNRLVDTDEIAFITVNGTEYTHK